ncbi:proline iminopeptidase-family hydrolase [Deinococcus sonorensis]|uniref:Proline iminopeptidase-family hydrolase n=2 Tax=Deinococcus sonorensis TaxID=309891 RepID=A0AAU7U6D6_9DEIO
MQDWQADREGTIDFSGFHTWYGMTRTEDAPGTFPVLVVHGGPGMPHDALEPLAALSGSVRRVVFYDQLGCGRSDRPADPSIYTIALFVRELQAVRDALGLTRVHVYGHSFGGALALQYALTHPEGLESLIIADSFATADGWLDGARQLRRQLPADVQALLDQHEAAGTTGDPAYQAAFAQHYLGVHCCRVPLPGHLQRAFAGSGAEVYRAMYGPQWFRMTGQYTGWTVVDRLPELQVPTLVLAGRYDQCVPALSEQIAAGIPGAELRIFEHSSHVPFVEEPQAHHQAVLEFLQRVERGAHHA